MTSNESYSASEKPIAVATVIQVSPPTSAKPGDKAFVGRDGILHGWVGGGCVQPAVLKISDQVLQSKQPCLLRVAPDGHWEPVEGMTDFASHCLGKGSVLLFVEPMQTQATVFIIGDTELAACLAELAAFLKLNVIWQTHAQSSRSLPNHIRILNDYERVDADFIVVATQGSKDKQAIEHALDNECPHVSMVVSERKLVGLKQSLQNEGMSAEKLERLKGQAGIRIGAQSPEEIALSVLAEIVQTWRATQNEEPKPNTAVTTEPNLIGQNTKRGGCCGG